MKTIHERAFGYARELSEEDNIINEIMHAYEDGAREQRAIDIANCVKWCENFNKSNEELGINQRIDVESFREWITDMIYNV